MLRTQDIYDTLADGCAKGAFVLQLTRPDRTVRTWWFGRPDEAVMKDKDLELVLSEAGTLAELDGALLAPGRLPGLWLGDALAVRQVYAYFQGGHAVSLDKGGYEEPLAIPRAEPATVDAAITHRRAGNHHQAIFYYRKALEADPENPNIMFNLSRVYHELGGNAEAKDLLERILSVKPDMHVARQYLDFLGK